MRHVPSKLDGLAPPNGICWSVALNFGVQLDGAVYPCAHPTDYLLGNVKQSSVAEIWNGAAARELRAAHLAKRAIAFCTGCIDAPYLGSFAARDLADERRRLLAQHRAAGHGNRVS